jgi:myb proto-oncogene protein
MYTASKKYHTASKKWTPEEDAQLRQRMADIGGVDACQGPLKWTMVAEVLDARTAKQCRERGVNHADPAIDKSAWTVEEQAILLEANKDRMNNWVEIAKLLPGRSQNNVKNEFHKIK